MIAPALSAVNNRLLSAEPAAVLRVSLPYTGNITVVISTGITMFSPSLKAAQPLACRLFESAVAQGKIANAYLLVGRAYDQKLALAREAACYFNCKSPTRESRGSCVSAGADPAVYCLNCQWISSGEHPQAWLMLSGEGKSQKIPVEKARLLTEELSKTSSFVRVVVVPQSDEVTFHRPAANALLKSIEEPPADVLFFFFADSDEDVLATIVSRCQVVPLSRAMSMGHWPADQTHAGELAPELGAKLDAARADFIMQSRQHFTAQHGAQQYFKRVTEGLALARQLQELSKELQEELEEHEAAEQVLDLFVASEMEVLKPIAADDAACARYLHKLLELVERTKRQINQYIKQTNAIESFSLSLVDLRQAHSGEISLAKR
jgi:DNA polymerase III delta prime subunit